ncbi:MAG: phosphoenolpyruvate carboxylase [Planctomycetales bacterium]
MTDSDSLRRDLTLLESLLAQIVTEDAGAAAVQLVAEIRQLARDRRKNVPGAEGTLSEKILTLTEDQARLVARLAGVYFDLANLAEDRQRIRVLRDREKAKAPEPISESIGAAIID